MTHRQVNGRRTCPHRKRRRGMRLFLRPSLLLMLFEGESHGYDLFDRLAEHGFDCERMDSSIVYRDLREMESLGLIESYWDDDSLGPRRRVYRILPEGLDCLADWMAEIEDVQTQMHDLLARYQALGEGSQRSG